MSPDKFPHDAAYKAFFTSPEMVKSLLEDFVPEDFIKYFDFNSLEKCSDSYITDTLEKRHNDVVWRVRWRKSWCYIYIIIEFQSTQDNWMPLRILTYTALLWEGLIKQGLIRTGEKLPPVFPVVIYNGENIWKAPERLEDLIEPVDTALAAFQPRQKYFLLDENRLDQALLADAKGESAYVFRLEQAKSVEEILETVHELSRRLKEPRFDFLRRAIYSWVAALINRQVPETEENKQINTGNIAMLEQQIIKWQQDYIQKGVILGKDEGIKIGKEEGIKIGKAKSVQENLLRQRITLAEMLTDRFENYPDAWLKKIETLTDPEFINLLVRSVYKVKTAEEFEELLKVNAPF